MIHPSPSSLKHPASTIASPARQEVPARQRIPWRDLLALAFLVGLAFLLLGREIVLGGSILDSDILLMSMPAYSWFAEGLKQGQFPIWSSAVLGGFPLSFAIYTFLYPPDLLFLRLLDGARAYHLSLALHLALAGCCTYWYCRVLGMRRLPSLLAAVAYQMGNEVLAWQSNGFITKTLFTMPALLTAVELMFGRNPWYWLLISGTVAMGLLGGYAQTVLYALAAAGVYALVTAGIKRRVLGTRKVAVFLVLAALGVALGLGLSAVRILPTLAATSMSTRAGGMDFQRSSVDSIDPWALPIGLILPAFFELPGWAAIRPDYLGTAPLLLATLALAFGRGLGRAGRFQAGLAVVATVLSLGEYTPLYGAMLHLPFFSLFRGASRFSPVAAFAMSVLAANALDSGVVSGLRLHRKRYLAVVAVATVGVAAGVIGLALSALFQWGLAAMPAALQKAVTEGEWGLLSVFRPRVGIALLAAVASPLLVLACARRRISRRTLEWSLLLLTSFSLFLLGWIQNLWLPPSALYEPPALLKTLKQDHDLFRVFSWAPGVSVYNVGAFYKGSVGRPPSPEFDERYSRQFFLPNVGMLFGVTSVEWYDALQTRRQALIANYIGSERAEPARYADGDSVDWKVHTMSLYDRFNLLAALNVKYFTYAFPIQDPRIETVDQVSLQIYPELPATAKVYLYRLKAAMPRAFVVPRAEVMPKEQQVLDSLLAGTADLRQSVILEQDPPHLGEPSLTVGGSRVGVQEYRDGQVILQAHTDGSGYLVLMDFLLPGWTATVDGEPVQILAANFAGRAVPISGSGDHEVEFSYQPPMLREGLAISLLSLLLVVSIPLTWWLRARSRRT